MKPGGRQYTLKHGKVLIKAIAAGIEPLEFRRKVEREMRLNLVVHDPDALFNIIDQQRRDRAVIEVNDAARRQKAAQRDARSVDAAERTCRALLLTNSTEARVQTAGVKAERNRRYENMECFVCGKQGYKQWDCPQGQQG